MAVGGWAMVRERWQITENGKKRIFLAHRVVA